MKFERLLLTILILLGCGFFPALLFAQGSLTPPGTPAPTMKSLDQIEPRIPVDANHTPESLSSEFTISSPGSYYLVGNIQGTSRLRTLLAKVVHGIEILPSYPLDGIDITTSGVKLDLMGYSITNVGGSATGILVSVPGLTNISIVNGTISNIGGNGIDTSNASNILLQNLLVANAGNNGIQLGEGCTVNNCTVHGCGLSTLDNGINALLDGCSITGCACTANYVGAQCYNATVSNCSFTSNTYDGLAAYATTVNNCTANYNSYGFVVDMSSVISACTVDHNFNDGIALYNGCRVFNNSCSYNGGSGIYLGGGGSRVEGNNVFLNNYGIYINNSGNLVIGNSASSNLSTPYLGSDYPGNIVGAIVTTQSAVNSATNSFINISY